MKHMQWIILWAALLAFALVISGCGQSKPEAPPEAPATPEVAPPAETSPAEAAPEEKAAPAAGDASAEGGEAPAEGADAGENKGPESIAIESKKGNIAFPHFAHQEVTDCKACHHKMEEGTAPAACKSCHDGDAASKIMKAAHKLCKDCHKEQGLETGCDSCHKK